MEKIRINALIYSLILFLTSAGGCSGPFKQANITANEFYRSPLLKNIGNSRIGFLTTVASRERGLSEYRVGISDIIEKAFRKEKPEIVIISSRETINSINNAALTDIYASMLNYYDVTGILNKNYLKKIGDALEVQYIAQPKLLSFVETTTIRLSALGLSIISTRETTVKLSLQLWDTLTGNIVWEASGQATVAVEAMRATPVTFEEVAEAASLGVVKKIPF